MDRLGGRREGWGWTVEALLMLIGSSTVYASLDVAHVDGIGVVIS